MCVSGTPDPTGTLGHSRAAAPHDGAEPPPGAGPTADDDSAPVVEFWRALGLPGLVDVHTHFMPQRVLDKVWAYFDAAGPLVGRAWPITYREAEHRRLERLRAYGVRAFSSLVYPHKPQMAAWLNAWAGDFAARTPDCVHTATFYPEPGAGDYMVAALDSGARIVKAHVQVGDYDPRSRLLDPVWAALQERQTPVVIHCGSGPMPGSYTGPGPIREVLARFPRLYLVVAHLGLPEYRSFLDLVERYPNVYLDTTMVFTEFTERTTPFPRDELPRLRALGHRVLFGSDFPNIPYPYVEALQALVRLELGSDWLRAVCHDNAAALLGLDLDTSPGFPNR
ncbi:amidohydrolase family protein [Lipingzhangella sp. LS1_29]|uniref:Amidohydrolase family protein n=1 Tax=Lipingzhangella rawalii TaxID=2055835 RepID=A0ABU2H928_9ACTN|nr:amidohydrolase family protein [Lipingzhangella rawalii]MDS1271359.1 amidohydrolase family protein [Lipingzhangella rawalii]